MMSHLTLKFQISKYDISRNAFAYGYNWLYILHLRRAYQNGRQQMTSMQGISQEIERLFSLHCD